MSKCIALRVILTLLTVLACSGVVYAWDVEYDASTGLLPTEVSQAWQLSTYDGVAPAIADGALRIQSVTTNSYAYYVSTIDADVPVTMEARMRVAATSSGAPVLSIKAKGIYDGIYAYSDHMAAYENASSSWVTFNQDFTAFRTIRIAYNGSNRLYAWVDGQLALSWQSFGGVMNGSGVMFGASGSSGAFDSYWQSIAYSNQFLPLPEPSPFLILGSSFMWLAATCVRRGHE